MKGGGKREKKRPSLDGSATFLRPPTPPSSPLRLFCLPLPSSTFSPSPKPRRCHFVDSQCPLIISLPPPKFHRGNASRLIPYNTVSSDRLVIVTSRESLPTTSSLFKSSRLGSFRPVHPAWRDPSAGQISSIHRRQSIVPQFISTSATVRVTDGESSVHDVYAIDSHRHPSYPSALRISATLLPNDNFISDTDYRRGGSLAKPLPVLNPFADHHHHLLPLRPGHQGCANDNNAIRHGIPAEWFQRGPFTGNPAEEA